jgi:ankyrin repeat protein
MSKTKLFAAAKSWDGDAVGRLLTDDPALVHARDSKGATALHRCAGRRWDGRHESALAAVATAKALLKAGADINAVQNIPDDEDEFPATALWYAVTHGRDRPLAEALLKARAHADHCLWPVVWSNDAGMARLLLNAGSRTEVKFHGETPLIYAARLGRKEVLRELVARKANLRARDSHGMTALDYAIKKRLGPELVQMLGGQATDREIRTGKSC